MGCNKYIKIGGLYEFWDRDQWKYGPYICVDITFNRYEMLHLSKMKIEKWYYADVNALETVVKLA